MPGKKFRFSLESVRRVRRHETQRAREELAEVLRRQKAREDDLAAAQARLDGLLREGLSGAYGPQSLRTHEAYRRDARQALAAARERLAELDRAEAEARQRLVDRRSAEEALDRLYEKEEAAFRREQEEAEMNFLDEQAITSYHRQKNTPFE